MSSFDYIALNIPHSSAAMCDTIPYDDSRRLSEDVRRWTDCHSFPSDLAADVDICIGFNEDDSKLSDEHLQCIADTFTKAGYRTCFNTPYSNAITPQHPICYKSVMIEVNKAVYMDERTLYKTPASRRLKDVIQDLYGKMLKKGAYL